MAEAVFTIQDLLNCPICLDLLKDPVTLPCGHSFCWSCIKDCWDQDDQKGSYSCPQCRNTFTPRPVLTKNIMLAELADRLMRTNLQNDPPVDSSVAPGDVECDVCTGRKHKAVKFCLVCLLSFCEAHIQTHYESPAYKKHKLVKASVTLKEKICPNHDKLLEAFCRTDQKLICFQCIDVHLHHELILAEAERNVKQNKLANIQNQNTNRIQQGEEKLKNLTLAMSSLQCSAQATVEESERLFIELLQSIEQRRSEVRELIRAQEKAELSHIEELLRKVEQEITDLRRRDSELKELSHTHDHIHFLQRFPSISDISGDTNISSITTSPQFSLEFVKKIGSMIKLMTDDLGNLEVVRISQVRSILPWEPKTREQLLKYFCWLTLNPKTASARIMVSEANKMASIPAHSCYGLPESSDCEIMCSEGLSKRCYWEVERDGDVSVTLSYENISRNGSEDKGSSWSLNVSGTCLSFNDAPLAQFSSSSKIGVYLDHKAGILAFYSVSNQVELLHRVYTTFTQPLYPRFKLKTKSSVRVCDLSWCEIPCLGKTKYPYLFPQSSGTSGILTDNVPLLFKRNL